MFYAEKWCWKIHSNEIIDGIYQADEGDLFLNGKK